MNVIFVIERMNKERLVNVMETIVFGPPPFEYQRSDKQPKYMSLL